MNKSVFNKKNKIFFIPFALIFFTTIFVGGNFYLSKQFAFFFNSSSTFYFNILFALIIIFIFIVFRFFNNKTSSLASFIYNLATIFLGLLLYLILSVFFVDLLNIFIKLQANIYGIIAIFITIIISSYGMWNAQNIRLTNVEIDAKKLSKKVKIVQLSDIHIGHFRGKKFFRKIIDKTIKQNPDFVVITGDLYDSKKHLSKKFLEPLAEIKSPVFFIEGNHDIYSGIDTLKSILKQLKVIVLDNEIYEFEEIQVIGLKYMKADSSSFDMLANETTETIKSVLSKMTISDKKMSVLLHHSPAGLNYINNKGIDLYLAGHTHAGQLFPMTIINKLVFKYNRGLYEFNNTKLFVSEGIGTSRPPMRIGTKSEIVIINLNN